MPRQLLRDGRVVDDDWAYLPVSGDVPPTSSQGLIISVDQWLADKPAWLAGSGRLGVVVPPSFKVEHLAQDLARFALVAADFPGPSEGRGYSQGRLLRERFQFRGELRAVGYVRRDQIFLLARCGFNSFEMPDTELRGALDALHTFSAEYQPCNDSGLNAALEHR
jgi:uncharacterized protein (DUF934 family)